LSDIKQELQTQKEFCDETQEYINEFNEKSEKVKKSHKSSHRSKLHPELKRFADIDPDNIFNTFEFPNTRKGEEKRENNTAEEEEEEREREDGGGEEDVKLEQIKATLAPKLAKIARAQRGAGAAYATIARAQDVVQVLVGGPTNDAAA